LRCRFGNGLTDATPMHVIIVIQIEGETVGLLADRVLDIITVDPTQIQPVPKVSHDARTGFLSGLIAVEKTMTALIDLKSLLSSQIAVHSPTPAKS
jgi:purine-binding chemotaxis protein CheW